jgi:cytochrome c oxidase cbb3-type subunit 3
MKSEPDKPSLLPDDPDVRPHTYDGIQEFDNKMPNWWLWTFYGAIILTFFYWFFFYNSSALEADSQRVGSKLKEMEAIKLASIGDLSNETLWQMATNPAFVQAGDAIYHGEGGCAACHGADLTGGIGLNLVDAEWKWGNEPMSIYTVINDGSPDKSKGMVAWESILGPEKIKQLTAYILSHHDEASLAAATTLNPPIGTN